MLTRRTIMAAAANLGEESGGGSTPPLALLELRNYVTRPGRRDALIDMFERHFLDAYESSGARILGTFRNADEPDRWVWIRAFPDNNARATALTGFYSSQAWRAMRGPANDTIADISDSILLRSMTRASSVPDSLGRNGVIECARHFCDARNEAPLAGFLMGEAAPLAAESGGAVLCLATAAHLPNTYPRLPLRDEAAVVLFTKFDDLEAQQAAVAARSASSAWRRIDEEVERRVVGPVERWRLHPTLRSVWR